MDYEIRSETGNTFINLPLIAVTQMIEEWMLLKRGMGNRESGIGNGEWGMGNGK